jgi:hypothetical protein
VTIDGLIKKMTKDEKFAKEFRTLARKLSRDRDKLMKDKLHSPEVTKRYMKSWAEFYRKFAFDPISLAALTVPEISGRAGYCTEPTTTPQLDILSHTQTTALYDIGNPKRVKPPAKPKSKATKKKASKAK